MLVRLICPRLRYRVRRFVVRALVGALLAPALASLRLPALVQPPAPLTSPRVAPAGDGDWRLELPPAYADALHAQGLRPLSQVNWRTGEGGGAVTATTAPGAVVLPGTAPAVIVAATSRDSVAVVLLRPASGAVRAERLWAEPWDTVLPGEDASFARTPDGHGPRVSRVLTVHRAGAATWVRWQDGDCKERGVEWRISGARVLKRASKCTYGE